MNTPIEDRLFQDKFRENRPRDVEKSVDEKTKKITWPKYIRATVINKNSSGDEIANVNFYAVHPEATRIRWNNAK